VSGLTTTEAPFIEQVRSQGQLFIEQPYNLYSEENHAAWHALYTRMLPSWERYANPRFLEGLALLQLDPSRIPRLAEVNRFLSPLTGFEAKPVSGYVPAFVFFDCLRRRQFPTTITIRRTDKLDYLPEPDIFHDIAGHVPMHTDPAFADTLVRFGDCAHSAAALAASIPDPVERDRHLESIIRAMARFFWFTIEFGLMRKGGELRVYGSGLLSSHGEIQHAVESSAVERRPIDLLEVINQPFDIDQYQPLLYVADSFSHVFQLVDELESMLRQGRLDNVRGGAPEVHADDRKSFLPAAEMR
jgi:phenylalanine-4-hydroxylase